MFTYLVEIKDKETKQLIESEEFCEEITFRQIFSGDTMERKFHNMSQLLFIQRVKEKNDPTIIDKMTLYIQAHNEDSSKIISISVKSPSGLIYLIKEFNSTLSKIELALTVHEDENYPLRYVLTLGE